MATLVTMAQARGHLRPSSDDELVDIALKLDQAEALVLSRCNSTAWWRAITATWTADTVPPMVTAAILCILTHLYENRGDDMTSDPALWAAVERMIGMNKDPVIC